MSSSPPDSARRNASSTADRPGPRRCTVRGQHDHPGVAQPGHRHRDPATAGERCSRTTRSGAARIARTRSSSARALSAVARGHVPVGLERRRRSCPRRPPQPPRRPRRSSADGVAAAERAASGARGRGPELPGVADRGQDLGAQPRRRHRPGAVGQPGRGLAQLVHLGPALVALAQVPFEGGPLEVVHGVQHVGADQGVNVGRHAVTPDARQSRSRISPSRIRVLTVASGAPSSSATCGYECPW